MPKTTILSLLGAAATLLSGCTPAPSSPPAETTTVSTTVPLAPGTLLFQETFDDANVTSRGWYADTDIEISTSEHVTGSAASVRYHFLPGRTNPGSARGGSLGAMRHKFTPSNSLYISYYVKYSPNWVGSGQGYHPHEFGVMSSLDADYDGPSNTWLTILLEHNYQNGGMPRMSMQDNKAINTTLGIPSLSLNLALLTENRSTAGCNGHVEANIYVECFNSPPWYNNKQLTGPVVFQPNPGPGYKGNWNLVEAYYQLNTIANGKGLADGVMQYWFNGTLIIDRHDILFRTAARPTIQFSQFFVTPYIGPGSPVDQSMWVDNLTVAASRAP